MDKWLMNNNAAKVIALVLGILLFAVVHKDDSTAVTTPPLMESRWIDSVQVRTIGLDTQQQVIKSMKPETVRIQVRGKRTTIAAALPEDYKVTLDLTGYGTGRHVVPLHHEFPQGIELVSMLPSSVTVDLEDVQTKEFEVRVKTEGIAAAGYKAGTPIVSPSNRVHVTLPASRMAEVKSVTAMVNIGKANESVMLKRVKLTAYNSKGQEIQDAVMTPSVVEVEIPITKPFKSVPLQVNLTGQLPDGLAVSTLTPDVNQITLYGPQEALDQFEFFDGVQVDLRQIKAEGVYKLNVRLTPPSNIEKIEPSEITVDLQISSVKQRVISGVPIILTGENDRLETTVAEPATRKMDVTVVGAPSLVDELKAGDIQLIANVNDLPPGKHTVNLQVNLPRFVRRADNIPLTVTIIIQDHSTPVTTEPDTKPTPPAGGDAGNSEGSQSETGQEEHKPTVQEDAGTSTETNDTSPDSNSENDQSS
ncbi:CdaR family protein [Paenibacillus sp. OSY-SE]|uniref:CdaR family protein n=1 Tax=Paenibacillus sp. OSY-SE TaxID=1196323 RepID=UPI0002D4687C|nr:CdaR family protein [Paenibacillus sp. OSY-SE]